MRTTLDIDEKLLQRVESMTGETSPSKAVNKVLAEYVRLRKLAHLRELIGTLELDDNWQELEELELKEQREQFQ